MQMGHKRPDAESSQSSEFLVDFPAYRSENRASTVSSLIFPFPFSLDTPCGDFLHYRTYSPKVKYKKLYKLIWINMLRENG